MVSTYTTNKHLEEPANGDYVDTWDVPVNANSTAIDTALGGTRTLTVTGQTGVVTLAVADYRPPILLATGVLTANVNYQFPSGIGGVWTVYNGATGSFTLTFSSAGAGSTYVLAAGDTKIIYSDGTNVALAVAGTVSGTTGVFSGAVTAGSIVATSASLTGALTADSGTVATAATTGDEIVNYSQFNPSAVVAGYIDFPGNVTMQWGNSAGPSVTITFPKPFGGTPWSIQMTIKDAPSGGSTITAQTTTSYTTTSFVGLTVDSASGGGSAAGFFWLAIGPTA